MKRLLDPDTSTEWQAAVDAAKMLLALDAARQYGLIEGGPEIDVDRCVDIIDRGKARGITPAEITDERIRAFLADLQTE